MNFDIGGLSLDSNTKDSNRKHLGNRNTDFSRKT